MESTIPVSAARASAAPPDLVRAVAVGGAVVGILDAIDAVVAFKIVLGLDPVPVYEFVASGLLGPSAFQGGVGIALLGLAIHFVVAFTAATVYAVASLRLPPLRERPVASGAAFGVAVWAFMNHVVIPLSRTPPSPFSLPLLLNGIVGHALFVGVPIAFIARRFLGVGAKP